MVIFSVKSLFDLAEKVAVLVGSIRWALTVYGQCPGLWFYERRADLCSMCSSRAGATFSYASWEEALKPQQTAPLPANYCNGRRWAGTWAPLLASLIAPLASKKLPSSTQQRLHWWWEIGAWAWLVQGRPSCCRGLKQSASRYLIHLQPPIWMCYHHRFS